MQIWELHQPFPTGRSRVFPRLKSLDDSSKTLEKGEAARVVSSQLTPGSSRSFVCKTLWITGIPHGIMEWELLDPNPSSSNPTGFCASISQLSFPIFWVYPRRFSRFFSCSRLQLFPQQLLHPKFWEASDLGCGCLGSLGRARLETRNVNTDQE